MTMKANGKDITSLHIDGKKYVLAKDELVGKIIKDKYGRRLLAVGSGGGWSEPYYGRMQIFYYSKNIAVLSSGGAPIENKDYDFVVKVLDDSPERQGIYEKMSKDWLYTFASILPNINGSSLEIVGGVISLRYMPVRRMPPYESEVVA